MQKIINNKTFKKDKILGFSTSQSDIIHQMTLLNDKIHKTFKL